VTNLLFKIKCIENADLKEVELAMACTRGSDVLLLTQFDIDYSILRLEMPCYS